MDPKAQQGNAAGGQQDYLDKGSLQNPSISHATPPASIPQYETTELTFCSSQLQASTPQRRNLAKARSTRPSSVA